MFPDSTAISFMPIYAFNAAVLYFLLVFASHYFLTTVDCTSFGQRAVQWPNELALQWIGKPLRLVWIAGLYLLPSVLLANRLGRAAGTPLVTFALTALALALLFPIGAVSGFISKNPWSVFHPRTLPLMLQKPGKTASFFLVAFAISLAGMAGFHVAIFSREFGYLGTIVGSLIGSFALFAYGCALGRYLLVPTYEPPPRKKRPKKRPTEAAAPTEPVSGPEPEPKPHWERPPPAWDPERDERPYMVHEAVALPKEFHEEIIKPKESEMKLLERESVPPPPCFAFGPEAFQPLCQAETLRNVIVLSLIGCLFSTLARWLIVMNPTK